MNANELRVGNWVSKHGEQYQCGATTILMLEREESDVQPIPLTEEWLLRFGLRKADEGCFWIDLQTHYFELIYSNLHWYPIISQLPEMSSEEEQKVGLNAIDHVHQLQNLFWALCGKELTIKEAAK